MELKLVQMACADMMILNKVDLVHQEHIGRIREWLDSHFHHYRLIEARHCSVPLEILLSVGCLEPKGDLGECDDSPCTRLHHDFDHSVAFSTWSYETDRSLSLESLRNAASKLPANIYRAKGVIYAADKPERRAVLQVVGRRVDISLAGAWGSTPPRTRIVVIGAAGAIDNEELRNRIEQCLT